MSLLPPSFPLVLRFRIQTLQMFGAKRDSHLLLYFMNYPARDVSGENRSRGVGARDVFFFFKGPKGNAWGMRVGPGVLLLGQHTPSGPSGTRGPSWVPLLHRVMLPARLLPSSSSAGTRGCENGWAGSSFLHSCSRRAQPRPAPCCGRADWLNQAMANLLLMFHALLSSPLGAAPIAALPLVWPSGGSQPGPGDGK